MAEVDDEFQNTTVINMPEAVGVFDRFEDLQQAYYDLRTVGFSRYDISLLGQQDALEEKLGKSFWRAEELEDDPRAPRAAFVSEDAIGALEGSLAGGFFYVGSMIALAAMLSPASTLAASIAAVAIGGSPAAVIGVILARRAGQKHMDHYTQQIEHGGLLLWVRVRDEEHERLAVEILKGHSGRDVHVHPWSE
ncbi:MAG: hypothetical protein V2J20_05005 [Wenzhouxiangella sp.]|jgi:hypothetical protein|nr:hypothetical protein [Wenzhouxiangella sp.]